MFQLMQRLFNRNGHKNGKADPPAPIKRLSPAAAMVPLARRGFPIGGDAAAAELEKHFCGWVYAAVRPIASTIAGQSYRLARERVPGSPAGGDLRRAAKAKQEPEILTSHPCLDALRKPNPLMPGWSLLFTTVASLELTGRCCWWRVEGENGWEFWPLPSSWLQPDHRGGPFSRWLLRPGGMATAVPLDPEEIIHFFYPDPSDPLACYSPLAAAVRSVYADESLQDSQRAAFDNGILPGLAIVVGDLENDGENENGRNSEVTGRPLLERSQREEIIGAIMKEYGSTLAAGRPIILDRLIHDIKSITNKPREMDFLSSGKSTKARIFQAFGVNPVIAGEVEGINYASSAAARKHFGEFCLNPKIELISEVLTAQVAPLFSADGEKLILSIPFYTPDDREQNRKDYALLAKHQAVNRNELRAGLLGLPALKEEGDTIPAPANQVLAPVRSKARKTDSEQAARLFLRNHREREKVLAAALETLFSEQAKSVAERLRALPGPTDNVDTVFDPQDWNERTADLIRPIIRQSIVTGAATELAQAEKSATDPYLDLPAAVRPAVDAALQEIMHVGFSPELHETTRQQLAAALREGVIQGESLYDLSVRIGVAPTVPGAEAGVLGAHSNTIRALRIARTETTAALNAGHAATRQALGLGAEWLAILDGDTRASHADMNGVKIGPGGLFDLAGFSVPYPGHHSLPAEERINCRCTTITTGEHRAT